MKICAIICEFNPFHNGHAYLIRQAREQSGADAVLCIMSGSFTQRGEICIQSEYQRARHAILAGADCVLELPAHFAVAPAEIFAAGAIKILSNIPQVSTLAFGCESCSSEEFYRAAHILLNENEKFKRVLQENLSLGLSYVKSYSAAFVSVGGNAEILQKPNNVLALEYVKSILKCGAKINILPIKRVGAEFASENLCGEFSSARAIRKNLQDENIKNSLPAFVYEDLAKQRQKIEAGVSLYEDLARFALFNTSTDNLKDIYGCTEGLENKLKSLQNLPYAEIIDEATSKRYSSSRIRRILCANALNITQSSTENSFKTKLYLKVLAVKKIVAEQILKALSESEFPTITGANAQLEGAAGECFKCDKNAYALFNHVFYNPTDGKGFDYMILV